MQLTSSKSNQMVATLFQVAAQSATLSSQRDTNQVEVWVYRSTHATSLLRYATDDAHQPGISSPEDQTLLTAVTGHRASTVPHILVVSVRHRNELQTRGGRFASSRCG